MGLKKPVLSEIAKDTYAINEFGMSTMYFLIGSERALLIDTACGLCDIGELTAGLTDLPYEVVLTHGHGDHVGGCTAFDSVWIHEADRGMVEELDRERLEHYIETMHKADRKQVYEIPGPDSYTFRTGKTPECKALKEGQVFDLGGRRVTVLETPGHTAGSCSLIDSESRILFSGDACNTNLGIQAAGVRTALSGLYKIREHRQEFDRNFSGHVGHIFGGEPDCRSLKDSVLSDCIRACEEIRNRTIAVTEGTNEIFGKTAFVCCGEVKVSFDPRKVEC